ncbi:MAG: coproporphyrinogen-III oxidase family protein [Candidatus Poribacteria bacterium]|nr:coproporphyrinogen-III oxidase family protein [Candidatus Poribacteria bacterium]
MKEALTLVKPEPATTRLDSKTTDIGSVFVSNYPPYSFWNADAVSEAHAVLNAPLPDDAPAPLLGLYMHIPFCRKRCKFCYFRVYTDKNARDIETYTNALATEVETYAALPRIENRPLHFVYFGGGTPSYISSRHLKQLTDRVKAAMPWDKAEEVAFECEPGTLTQPKVAAIKEIGVTRLSLGVENLNDDILRENGRAHISKEVYRVMPWVLDAQFDQLNVDLIAGMIGETWENWRDTVQKTIDLNADSVTVYQLELPHNTVYSRDLKTGEMVETAVATWDEKREWHAHAFEQFCAAGYEISSAYTVIKRENSRGFVYRDAVWTGQDLIGTGVASFSHVGGVHFQNAPHWDGYLEPAAKGRLPIQRAFQPTEDERVTRQMILQLKIGKLNAQPFRDQFGVDIIERHRGALERLRSEGMLEFDGSGIELTQAGFLRVDQLLPEFYAEKYRNSRYT